MTSQASHLHFQNSPVANLYSCCGHLLRRCRARPCRKRRATEYPNALSIFSRSVALARRIPLTIRLSVASLIPS